MEMTPEARRAAGRFSALADEHRCWNTALAVQENMAEQYGLDSPEFESERYWIEALSQLAGLIDAGEAS